MHANCSTMNCNHFIKNHSSSVGTEKKFILFLSHFDCLRNLFSNLSDLESNDIREIYLIEYQVRSCIIFFELLNKTGPRSGF